MRGKAKIGGVLYLWKEGRPERQSLHPLICCWQFLPIITPREYGTNSLVTSTEKGPQTMLGLSRFERQVSESRRKVLLFDVDDTEGFFHRSLMTAELQNNTNPTTAKTSFGASAARS